MDRSFLCRALSESKPKAKLELSQTRGGTEYERISNINQTGEA